MKEKKEKKDKKDKKEKKEKKEKKKKDKEKRPTEEFTEVEKGKIYEGVVTKVQDFGVFIQLNNFKQRKEGLVHISNIREKRVTNPFEILKRN